MLILKLNHLKKKILDFLTCALQNSKRVEQIKNLPRDSNIKVLISRPNHRLGNQLLLTPLIEEVKKEFPNCKIHLVVNGDLSTILFSQDSSIENIFNLPKKPFNNIFKYISKSLLLISTKYDIAIAADENSNSSKIFVKLSRAKFKVFDSGTNSSNKPLHIAKIPVFNFQTLINPSKNLRDYKYSKLAIKLTHEEIEKGNLLIRTLFDNNKKTICIFTFATGHKCHSKEWWSPLYEELKNHFNHFNILEMLPIENVSQINFKSTHFYGKDLREIASIIENCTIFIGADSGMMHLSAATNTTTLGLFNVTNSKVYSPYGNKNQSINTNSLQLSEIIEIIKKQTVENNPQ
jgi:ADP-heptose:LPS heptosyltransferase